MSASHLAVVPGPAEDEAPAQNLSETIQQLQARARELARLHIHELCATLAEVSRVAAEVAQGGDAYPVGARELCRCLAEEACYRSRTLGYITERGGQ